MINDKWRFVGDTPSKGDTWTKKGIKAQALIKGRLCRGFLVKIHCHYCVFLVFVFVSPFVSVFMKIKTQFHFPDIFVLRDPEQITAANVLSHVDEDSLYKVLKYYGEESHARPLARALVESRCLFQRFESTKELANLVSSVVEGSRRTDRLGRHAHPATKTFQVGKAGWEHLAFHFICDFCVCLFL